MDDVKEMIQQDFGGMVERGSRELQKKDKKDDRQRWGNRWIFGLGDRRDVASRETETSVSKMCDMDGRAEGVHCKLEAKEGNECDGHWQSKLGNNKENKELSSVLLVILSSLHWELYSSSLNCIRWAVM